MTSQYTPPRARCVRCVSGSCLDMALPLFTPRIAVKQPAPDNLPSHIKLKDWPSNSPDLSPIENLWSILPLSVYKDPEPKNGDQLKRRLQRVWRSIEVGTLQSLIQSMPDRVDAVIKRKGNTVR